MSGYNLIAELTDRAHRAEVQLATLRPKLNDCEGALDKAEAELAKSCEETREAWGVIGQLMTKHTGKEGIVLTRKIAELEHDLAEEMLRSRTAEAEVEKLRALCARRPRDVAEVSFNYHQWANDIDAAGRGEG